MAGGRAAGEPLIDVALTAAVDRLVPLGEGLGVGNLADPIKVDSANPDDPMAQLAVVMLALFAQMKRTYMLERVAHARLVAAAHGRLVGRPVKVDAGKLHYTRRLRDEDGLTLPEIVERTGLTRSTLYRHLHRQRWTRTPQPTLLGRAAKMTSSSRANLLRCR